MDKAPAYEQEILGSSPSTGCFWVFCCWLFVDFSTLWYRRNREGRGRKRSRHLICGSWVQVPTGVIFLVCRMALSYVGFVPTEITARSMASIQKRFLCLLSLSLSLLCLLSYLSLFFQLLSLSLFFPRSISLSFSLSFERGKKLPSPHSKKTALNLCWLFLVSPNRGICVIRFMCERESNSRPLAPKQESYHKD